MLFLSGVRVARSLVSCVMICRLLFVIFLLAIVVAFLRFTDSDYPFGVFKLILTLTTLHSNMVDSLVIYFHHPCASRITFSQNTCLFWSFKNIIKIRLICSLIQACISYLVHTMSLWSNSHHESQII